jgi:hypothetical protein
MEPPPYLTKPRYGAHAAEGAFTICEWGWSDSAEERSSPVTRPSIGKLPHERIRWAPIPRPHPHSLPDLRGDWPSGVNVENGHP